MGHEVKLIPLVYVKAVGNRQKNNANEAAAMLERLLHRCHVVKIRGSGYRMRDYKATHGRSEATPKILTPR